MLLLPHIDSARKNTPFTFRNNALGTKLSASIFSYQYFIANISKRKEFSANIYFRKPSLLFLKSSVYLKSLYVGVKRGKMLSSWCWRYHKNEIFLQNECLICFELRYISTNYFHLRYYFICYCKVFFATHMSAETLATR